jgi:hypothetical protein
MIFGQNGAKNGSS